MNRTPLLRKTRLRRSTMAPKTRMDPARTEWSLCVRLRDDYTCQKCGRSKAQGYVVQAAHILGAGAFPQLKYVLANGITLCFLCHRWYDQHKSSKRDGESDLWVREKIGEPAYTFLLVLAKTMRQMPEAIAVLWLRMARKRMEKVAPAQRADVLESLARDDQVAPGEVDYR